MKKAFVIISVSDRVEALNGLVESIKAHGQFNDYSLHLMFQDPAGVAGQIQHRERYEDIFVVPEKLGCHGARVELLRRIRADMYVNLDDDMELCEHTDYANPIWKAGQRSTGFVLTNWARTRALMLAKVPRKRHEFIKQALVYQGGGMVYRDEVADLMRKLPAIKQTFDHAWPLTAYINGFTNYRYMGSLAVHKVMGKGGMSAFMDENPVQLMMREYVNFKPTKRQRGNGHDVCIPLDADLTPLAHEAHRANKK